MWGSVGVAGERAEPGGLQGCAVEGPDTGQLQRPQAEGMTCPAEDASCSPRWGQGLGQGPGRSHASPSPALASPGPGPAWAAEGPLCASALASTASDLQLLFKSATFTPWK